MKNDSLVSTPPPPDGSGQAPLMQIVPGGVGLEFEVWEINRDIGFIYDEQEAEIAKACN